MQAKESGCHIIFESEGSPNGMKKVLLDTKYDELTRTYTGAVDFGSGGKIEYKFIFNEDFTEIHKGDRNDKNTKGEVTQTQKFGRGEELEYNIDPDHYTKW